MLSYSLITLIILITLILLFGFLMICEDISGYLKSFQNPKDKIKVISIISVISE
ncbi:hypothetical protein QFZ51_000093 [Chitinophaga sp. W3I9]